MSSSDASRNTTSEETETNADLLGAVNAGIEKMRLQLTGTEKGTGTVTDLIRLLQLRKELDGDRPRHVTVRWIGEDE
jgi:hypothetical protein